MKWFSKQTYTQPSHSLRYKSAQRRAIQCAVVALIDVLEPRMLLAATFANLPYTDPLPEPVVAGEHVQAASTVVIDQPQLRTNVSPNLNLPTPAALQAGTTNLSIEFALKLTGPANSRAEGILIEGPGFQVQQVAQYGTNGAIEIKITHAANGVFITRAYAPFAVIPGDASGRPDKIRLDGRWHYYTVTSDAKTIRIYADGELVWERWQGNTGTQNGPMNDGTNQVTVPQVTLGKLTGYSGASGEFKNVRVSTVLLDAAAVKKNFENIAKATIAFASPTGTAGAAGTRAQPLSLAGALAQAGPNKRIVLLPGTYDGSVFQLTTGGADALNPLIITGDNGADQAIIATTGTTSAGLTGTGYVRLQNLTFRGDTGSAFKITNSTGPVTLDAVRMTSNANGLTVTGSPQVYVQNSVISVPGTGMSFDTDKVYVRNNTIVGGAIGIDFGSVNSFVLTNNLFSGSATSIVSNPTSYSDQYGWLAASDGNNFSPAPGGKIAILNGTSYTAGALDAYRQNWYFNQNPLKPDNSRSTQLQGYINDDQSMSLAPVFSNAQAGDFRLQAVSGNVINAGVGTDLISDATGAPRKQGAQVDVGAYETVGPQIASFTLAQPANTSAGIYDVSGKLVKTLWSGKPTAAGTVTVDWNGLNDLNQPLAAGQYTAKLLSNNVEYVFEGSVGNNSNPINGPKVLGDFYTPQSVTIVPNNTAAFYTGGYNEARFPLRKFDVNTPTQADRVGSVQGWGHEYPRHLTSDTSYVYYLRDGGGLGRVSLATGAFDLPTATGSGAGIAVQPNGSLLFVSNPGAGRIDIYNKTTFASVGSFAVANPGAIAAMSSGDLWVVSGTDIVRYTNLTASTPTEVRRISGFAQPKGIAVSHDGALVAVADGGTSQQVKAFNTATGASAWTYGQAGGYASGPAVATDKLLLNGAIAFGADGSFWIQDDSTYRMLHISAQRQFINNLAYIPHSYSTAVDLNNPTRMFNGFTEYEIDYSKSLVEGQGWKPKNYWGHGLPSKYFDPQGGNAGGEAGFIHVTTLSNGKTYARVPVIESPTDQFRTRLLELTATGTRITNTTIDSRSEQSLDKDATQRRALIVGNTVQFQKQVVTGFNATGDPIYSVVIVEGTAPFTSDWKGSDPASDVYTRTDSGLLVSLNRGPFGGFHLGAVTADGTDWLWKAAPAHGGFTGNAGVFDSNSIYPGNFVQSIGRNVVFGYHGEFWQGNGQANQFIHYYDDGLAVGQFGTPLNNNTGNDGVTGNAVPGASGNAFKWSMVTGTDGKLYLYHNDESARGSLRWRIDNTSSIVEQTAALGAVTVPGTPSGLAVTTFSSSQINLTWTDNSNNESGFKIERATNSTFTQNLTLVTTTAANATSHSNTGLSASTTYYYRVRATNAGGDSANTATASATTPVSTVGSFSVVSMTNDANSGISSSNTYHAKADFQNAGTTINGVSFTDTGISGTNYTLSANVNQTAGSTYGDQGQNINRLLNDFRYADGAVGAQMSLTLTNLTIGGGYALRFYARAWGGTRVLDVTGSEGGSQTGYNEDGNGSHYLEYAYTASSSTASVTFTTTAYNSSYHFYGFTNQVVTTPTPPPAPSGLTATATSQSQINLGWADSSSNETGFKVDRATNSSFTQDLTTVTVGANTTVYNDTGLSAAALYYYRVRATNAAGDSASATASATTLASISSAPTALSLLAASDTGASNSDGITRLNNALQFAVTGTLSGATVNLYDGTTLIGSAIAAGTTATVTSSLTLADGVHSITAKQIETGKSVSAASPLAGVTIDTVAPTAPAFSVNSGQAQRSMVKTLSVVFSEKVSLPTGSLVLQLHNGSPTSNINLILNNASGDGVNYTVAFSGTAIVGKSLPDGIYDLIAKAVLVQDVAGNNLAGNASFAFHRRFGDYDGNKTVNNADYFQFKKTFGKTTGQSGFFDLFDYDGNGTVNNADYFQFKKRFGLTYVY